MVELVWKHKHHPLQHLQPVGQHQLITRQAYPLSNLNGGTPLVTEGGWANRLIWGERREVLLALLADVREKINLIYIDPPFMTGRTFMAGQQVAYRDNWQNDLDSYLQWLYETFVLLHALLAPDGSIYVHLDWRATHHARIILDEIFGYSPQGDGPGFKNEIIWHYQSGGRTRKYYARKHDSILLYTKSADYCFHGERVAERRGAHKRNHMRKEVGSDGRVTWTIRSAGRIYSYPEDAPILLADVWNDISHLQQRDPERTGYATQKPASLLERIIQASSEENDLVLDCFCGSGVTPSVAEQLGRRWIACDQSELAIITTRERLLATERIRPFLLQESSPKTSPQGHA